MPFIERPTSEIKRRRLALGLTQEEAAVAVGLSFACFTRTERVPQNASRNTIAKIARRFGCLPEELLVPATAAQDAK
jgi:transcriptional regulator with XRE-family HTH domain